MFLKILLLNQTFYPDVASTAQHLTDLALALAERGHEVTVVTGRRAYDDPTRTFAKTETWRGIRILRLATTSFGKTAKWRRAADFASFIIACCLRLLTLPRPDAVMALTTPPLISFIGAVYARWRGARFYYWVMDLNPDEAIAAGWLREDSAVSRMLQWMSRYSFRHSKRIIALDRFMRARIEAKGIVANQIAVIPPWSHDDAVRFDGAGREAFRRAHGLSDKFVVMYSGNHSPCHPLDTLLAAAEKLAQRKDLAFCFVGGGSEWRKIKERGGEWKSEERRAECEEFPSPISHLPSSSPQPSPPRTGRDPLNRQGSRIVPLNPTTPLPTLSSPSDGEERVVPQSGIRERSGSSVGQGEGSIPPPISHLPSPGPNERRDVPSSILNAQPSTSPLPTVLCLPYQPLDQLSASLSAADLHVVVMGDPFVGTIHPCKIYNVLSVGAPILYIGPEPSHLSEVLDVLKSGACGRARHGDVDGCAGEIERIAAQKLRGEPERYAEVAHRFSQRVLLPQLVAEIERGTDG